MILVNSAICYESAMSPLLFYDSFQSHLFWQTLTNKYRFCNLLCNYYSVVKMTLHLVKSTLWLIYDLKLKVKDLRLDPELGRLELGLECKDLYIKLYISHIFSEGWTHDKCTDGSEGSRPRRGAVWGGGWVTKHQTLVQEFFLGNWVWDRVKLK